VVSKIQLAHFASAQATNLAIELSGKIPTIDLNVVPSCVYTSPEIASVGMTLQQAESRGIKAKELKVQMQGNGKSVIEKQERGFIKVVIEEESEKIIGAHIICNRATDMISEFVLAISLGLTRKDLAKIIRPHPTYSESISEVLFQ
jgi:dihydrolipoamide dehydrogenase